MVWILDLVVGLVAFVLSNAAYACLGARRDGITATMASIYLVAGLARGESGRSKVLWLVFRVLAIHAIPIALLSIELYAPSTVLRPAVILFPTVFQFPLMISIPFTIAGLLTRVYWASMTRKRSSLTDRLVLSSRVSNGVLYALGVAVFGIVVVYSVSASLRATRTPWRGPYLQSVTPDSVWVVWDTVKPSTGLVEYGLTPELGRVAGESRAVLHHEVQLTGLRSQSVYYYRVDGGAVSRFRTAPASRQAGFRFAVVGDTRTNHRVHRAMIEQAVKTSPDLVLHTGDLVESGGDSGQWDRFFWIEAPLLRTAPFYPVLGGHEERASHYLDSFVLPGNERWYAFEYGPARFVALRIDGAFDPGYEQMRWLERQLSTNDSPWLFVYFHVPVYSSCGEDDLEVHLRHTLVPLFERYGVDMVFMGHQHSYERIAANDITYIVTAGGGAPLYNLDEPEPGSQVAVRAHHFLLIDLDPRRLTGTAIDRHGQVIDRFELLANRSLQADHGCTSFCLDVDGQLVFGANYDTVRAGKGLLFVNKRGVAKHGQEQDTTGEVAHWVSKYGSVTFNNTSYEHAWSGMNEAGLVISTMHLPETQMPAPDARPPLIVGQWLQYQLDNFSTVDQVIASDSQIRIRSDDEDHHLVCDRAGDCASIEFLNGKLVYHTGETMPVKALTNTGYAEAFAFLNKGRTRSLNISLDRFVRVAHMMSRYDPERSNSAIAYAFDILSRVGSRRHTQWSIVYDVGALRIYFYTKSSPQVRCLDLEVLDFSCATPVQMLDINADLSGDVADDLQPYSHQAALAQLWWFVREQGLEDTYAESEAYIAHLEGYTCTEEDELLTGSQDVPSPGAGMCADYIPALPEREIGALWLVGSIGAALAAYVVYRLYRAKKG